MAAKCRLLPSVKEMQENWVFLRASEVMYFETPRPNYTPRAVNSVQMSPQDCRHTWGVAVVV